MKKRRAIPVLMVLVLLLSACSREPEKNTNLALYVSEVIVQGEGSEAFVCAFILQDAESRDTANNGTITMEVEDREGVIFSLTWTATVERFTRAELTRGSHSEQHLLYLVGRFEYSRFSREPLGAFGQVTIVFDNGTSVIRGRGPLLFEHN